MTIPVSNYTPVGYNGGTDNALGTPDTGSDIKQGIATDVWIGVGSMYEGYLGASNDVDGFRMGLSSGQTITIEVDGLGFLSIGTTSPATGHADPAVQIINGSGTVLASNNDGVSGTYNAILTYTAPSSDTYWFNVYDGNANQSLATGAYIINVSSGSTPIHPTFGFADVAEFLRSGYNNGAVGTMAHWTHSNFTVDLTALPTHMQASVIKAEQAWSDAINVTFTNTTGTVDLTYVHSGSGFVTDKIGGNSATTTTVDSSYTNSTYDANSYFFDETFVHELGHFLGLGHAGNYNFTVPSDLLYSNDSLAMSVMSYIQDPNQTDLAIYDATPMGADVLAAQTTYGASSVHSGSDTYGFNATDSNYSFSTQDVSHVRFNITDSGGGADILDDSGSSSDDIIDIRPGSISKMNGHNDDVSISPGSIIERVVGGSGNDTITGNDEWNFFYPSSGNDSIDGKGAIDGALYWSHPKSSYTITHGSGSAFTVSGPEGTQSLNHIEQLYFSDQTTDISVDIHVTSETTELARYVTGQQIHYAFTETNSGLSDTSGHANLFQVGGTPWQWVYGMSESAGGGTASSSASAFSLSSGGSYTLNVNENYGGGNQESEVNTSNDSSSGVAITVVQSYGVDGNGFDWQYYLANNADLVSAGITTSTAAWNHWHNTGWTEGRNPNADFNTSYYLSHNADVAAANVDPLLQYHNNGFTEHRNPSAYFNTDSYLSHNSDVAGAGIDPLVHFLNHLSEGRESYLV